MENYQTGPPVRRLIIYCAPAGGQFELGKPGARVSSKESCCQKKKWSPKEVVLERGWELGKEEGRDPVWRIWSCLEDLEMLKVVEDPGHQGDSWKQMQGDDQGPWLLIPKWGNCEQQHSTIQHDFLASWTRSNLAAGRGVETSQM